MSETRFSKWETFLAVCLIYIAYAVNVKLGCFALESGRFLVIGDWGGVPTPPYSTHRETQVAEELGKLADVFGAEFNLGLGDNFYFDGVKDVNDKRFKETFEDVFTAKSLYSPWYFIAGNHDHYGNVSAQIAYTNVSTRWNFPSYYYNLRARLTSGPTLEIVMIDTVILCGNTRDDFVGDQPRGPESKDKAEEQWVWIEETLMKSSADYLIVAGHFPVYSVAEHGPTKRLVSRLLPLLIKYGVTAYYSGHDHNLQHLQVHNDSQALDFFVVGAANWCQHSTKHQKDVPVNSLQYYWAEQSGSGGVALIEFTSQNMTHTFFESNGKILYQKSMKPRS